MSLRGEWWIDDSGGATFADGEIGDQNHEIIAFWSALGVDPDEAFSLGEILPDEGLSEEQASGLLEMGADSKAVEFFSGDGGDARDYMMVERAWIRVANNNFQLWNLDDEALGRIRDFVSNEYPEDEDPLEDEFQIEELREDGVHLNVSGSDLLESGKSADALKYSARRERPGMYNPKASERTYYEIGHRGLKSKLWYGDEFNINVEPAEFDTDDKDVDPRNLHNEWALRMPWHGRYDPYSGEVSIMGGTMTEEWRQPSEQMLDRLRETFGADVKIVQFNPSSGNQEHTGIHNPPYDPKELKRGIKVEKEHTDDPKIAKQIAMDHLNEDPRYYSRLLACGITHNPPIRHAWEMTYDELLGELESLNSVVDREGLDRLRPLLAEVYPEYVDVDYRDYTQDPWGIGRAIQAGTEIPRAPTVDLSRRLRKLKEARGIEYIVPENNPRRRGSLSIQDNPSEIRYKESLSGSWPEGTVRKTPTGKIQIATRIPLNDLEITPGNKIYADVVKRFMEDPPERHPTVFETRCGYWVDDGNHRIVAAKERGERDIIVWLEETDLDWGCE